MPIEPVLQREHEGDEADDEAHVRFRHDGGGGPADPDADQGRGQHDLEVRGIELAPVGGDADHVHADEDRQHDASGLDRRNGERHHRHREPAEAAQKAAFRKTREQDRRNCDGVEEGVFDHRMTGAARTVRERRRRL